jgi:HEAT repeat protein
MLFMLQRLTPLVVTLAALGCSGKPEPPAANKPAAESPSPNQPAAIETPAEKLATETPDVPAPTPPPKQVDIALRDTVGRLARKEGTAWKIDEKADAKLDELGIAAADQLLPMLADSSADVRRGAAWHLLSLFDAGREEMVAAYLKLLSDDDRTVRGIALSAMPHLRPAQKVAAAPELAKMLARSDEEEQHRATAARLIGDAGNEAASLLPQLIKAAAGDTSPKVRAACLLAVSKIAPPSEAVSIFQKALSDQDASVRSAAFARLKALGRDAAPAIDDLAKLLEDPDDKTRLSAAEALVRIGTKSLPAFEKALESTSAGTRQTVVLALGKMGPAASPALPALNQRLKDDDPKVQELAKAAIAQIERP